jgi:hypothetical protein
MTVDANAPIIKHTVSAKEHLAGIKGAQVYHQELAAKHLLDSQQPVKNTPYPAESRAPE